MLLRKFAWWTKLNLNCKSLSPTLNRGTRLHEPTSDIMFCWVLSALVQVALLVPDKKLARLTRLKLIF